VKENEIDYLMDKYKGKKVFKVKSFSRPDEFHFVYYQFGRWECSCEFKLHHPSKECDHIRQMKHKRMKYHGRHIERKKRFEKAKREAVKLEKTLRMLEKRRDYICDRQVPKGGYYDLKYKQEIKVLTRDIKNIDRDIKKILETWEIKRPPTRT